MSLMNKNDYEQPLLDGIYENSSKKFSSCMRGHSNRNQKSWDIRNTILNNFFENEINSKNSKYKRKTSIDNSKNRIYIDQKDVNNIFSECYDGLYSLKCVQDEFDIKYNALKNKLITKINENNNI